MGPSSSSLPQGELDGHLSGTGYEVGSSNLCHVAQRLESATVSPPSQLSQLASHAVHYNPTDLVTWVESLLSESSNHPSSSSSASSSRSLPVDLDDLFDAPTTTSWFHPELPLSQPQQQLTVVATVEEVSGIRLVHALMMCADSVQRGDFQLAGNLIDEMNALLTRVNTGCGIGKVAECFIEALSRRILGLGPPAHGPAYESEVLYHHFYEACPYLKFAHFTANQAILEACDGHECMHVIDFSLMHGLQWPALIQALALRPGGPPLFRLTGIGPPSPDGRNTLREIGLRLTELAQSVNVGFAFRGVAASRLEDVKPWMLQVAPNEAVGINSIMQLHKLLGPDQVQQDSPSTHIEPVLRWIRELNPKIVTVVEQEASHNRAGFFDRFTEALYYYSTMFDSLEAACPVQPDKALAEMYLRREICDIVCCEGAARVERHEPLAQWRDLLGRAGFRQVHLSSKAFKQASMLLTLFSAEGYSVEENEGCLTLGWHSRPLFAVSAWQASPAVVGPQTEANDNN